MPSFINHVPQTQGRGLHFTKVLGFHKSKPLLPPQTPLQIGKPTLVLDLDHTLVHSSLEDLGTHDSVLDVLVHDSIARIYMCKRPGLDQFLQSVAQYYELAVFTAAERDYAEAAIDEIDPFGLISHRLFRDSCTNGSVKDLSKLGRNMKRVVIVDDNPCSFMLNPANGFQIGRFYCDDRDEDQELLHLTQFLCKAALSNDLTSALTMWSNPQSIQVCAYGRFGF